MIGFQETFERFLVAAIVVVLTAINGMAVGTVAGSAFNDIGIALAILPLVLLPLMIFSGLFVNLATLPIYFYWIQFVSPTKYAYAAVMKNEYDGLTLANCNPATNAMCTGAAVLESLGMQGGLDIFENIMVLVAMYVGLMLVGFLALGRLAYFYK